MFTKLSKYKITKILACKHFYILLGYSTNFKLKTLFRHYQWFIFLFSKKVPLSWPSNYSAVSYMHEPCMINRIRDLRQHTLQVNGQALFHLHGLHRAMWKGEQAKNSKWNYISPLGIEPAIPRFPIWPTLDNTATLIVCELCFYYYTISVCE